MPNKLKIPKPPRIGSKLERRFSLVWRAVNGPALVREYTFHPVRRWRFDFAHVASRTAIECEGGLWSGGRHTRGSGFKADCEKYNEAALMGWQVFRLATGMVRMAAAEQILKHIGSRMITTPFLVGSVRLAYSSTPGKVWLANNEGEGMETDEAKLEECVAEFLKKEF